MVDSIEGIRVTDSVADPDPHGSAFKSPSGSAWTDADPGGIKSLGNVQVHWVNIELEDQNKDPFVILKKYILFINLQ